MSARIVFCSALVMIVLSLAPARAQYPSAPMPREASSAPSSDQPVGELPAPVGLSSWITYNRDCCQGPLGDSPRLSWELFLRSGWSVPTGVTTFGKTLQTGWEIMGGGRMLLFNQPQDAAWTLEASLSNTFNQGQRRDITFPLNVLDPGPVHFGSGGVPGVTTKSLNRTFVSLGPGREWYLLGTGNSPGMRWRIGVDGGGRWGSERLQLNEFHHRTDTIGGVYAALHTDLEIPCGCCTFYAGIRGEWDYTWSDILQTSSDVMGANALITVGLRY
jgi:hypothetical protein